MRSDMQKVIVERPRYGSARPNRKSGGRLHPAQVRSAIESAEDYDGGPTRASSARHDKSLNENLAPLRRYLAGQVGRPWNKVYGEIRRTLDTRSAIGLHVLQHLEDFVTVNTVVRGGVVYGRRRWSPFAPVKGLYVHPVTGLLRTAKSGRKAKMSSRREIQEPNFVRASENVAYERINGIWFLLEYAEVDTSKSPRLEPGAALAPGTKQHALIRLLRKRQCDSKTNRQIERGELGRLTVKTSGDSQTS
jgi:hypothetical protein